MKITRATTYIVGNPWKNWLFVRLDTDQPGLYGVGEGTLNAFARTVEAAIHELAPRYEGMDPFQVETIYQRMTRDLYSDGGQIHMNAVAAIEIACWDIIGKVTGQPVYDLLGGRYHEDLPAYANGWYQGQRTPEIFAEQAAEVVARGYKALKFDPFGAAWRTMTQHDRQLSLDIVARGARRGRSGGPDHDRRAPPLQCLRGDLGRRTHRRVRPDLVRGADRPHQDRRHRRGRRAGIRSRFRPGRASTPPISSPSC